MNGRTDKAAELGAHGASILPSVEVDSYNLELEDNEGFVGDRASKSAFVDILDRCRESLRKLETDPLGKKESEDVSKKKLEAMLAEGDPYAAALVHSAIEEFAQVLGNVIKRFLRAKGWHGTQCLVVGGGFRANRVGEIAVGRAALILAAEETPIDLRLIRNDPDDAGLIGAVHLMPAWTIEGRDGILAVDIGGTNIRAGIVESRVKKAPDLSKASVWDIELWRHGDENPSRGEAVDRLVEMLQDLISRARKAKFHLAPVIGIGCPGRICEDGSIEAGAQNLPGNWQSSRFNLPNAVREAIPHIGEHETTVRLHNDAVVQGLSELPKMQKCRHWGVLTIGTGLGNARFTNRRKKPRRA